MIWRPRGALAWLLTIGACLLGVSMAALSIWMRYPVRWNGPGEIGAVALYFPLHLLLFSAAAAVLVVLARRWRAMLAAWGFCLIVILTAAMALAPTVAVWRQARRLSVELSLGGYLRNAVRLNLGPAQPERTVVYGTATDGTKLELDVWSTDRHNTGPLRPAIVMIHGGAWTHGHRSMLPDWDAG